MIIDHVPAWICKQCGEVLFDEETVKAIQAMPREVDKQAEALAWRRRDAGPSKAEGLNQSLLRAIESGLVDQEGARELLEELEQDGKNA